MKQLLTTTFLFLLIFSSFSQQISVKSFRMLESDQEARIISPKKDQNGKKAAIIKVVTSQTGFVFDFGLIGNALATEQKTGEIWVWVPAGARKVTINHQQLGVLRNYEFEIDIQEATVYEMILTTGKVTTIVEEEQISTEWVVITSEPSGADVYIDDKATGMQTPYRKQLPMGAHTYRVSLDMYYPDIAKFELKPEAGKMKINSILKPAFGQLKLTSTPESGATVTLDGKPLSQITPCTIEKIKSGTHSLIVNKALYHDATQNIEIKDEQTNTLAIDLKPAFGTITVSSTPESGAAVTLDDVATGKVTPCTLDKVQSGNHTVALRREWYAPIKKQLTVNDGEKATLEVAMNPLFGEVKITTTPEADIFIDNAKIASGTYNGRLNEGVYTIEARKLKHTTDLQKIQIETGATKTLILAARPQLGILEIDSSPLDAVITLDGVNKGTTPTTLRNLLVGDYNISLSLPNYATVSKTITIAEGQTTKVNETLANGRPVTISSTPTGATLFIDGNKIGNTPYSGSLAFGNHTLRIEKDGKKAEKTISIIQSGGETSFTLSFAPLPITDIDGNIYTSVTIGTQTWMVENLKTTHYRNGDPIPNVTDKDAWRVLSTGGWCDYNNDSSNGSRYGHLYNWFAVRDSRKIAPVGWHVPTSAEWSKLINYLGGKEVAGGKLKEAGSINWSSPNSGATNETGFFALPGGAKMPNFSNARGSGVWWCSDEYDATSSWYIYMDNANSSAILSSLERSKVDGFSVRCVKDLPTQQNNIETVKNDNKFTANNSTFQSFTETVKGVRFDMVAVKGGTFQMGSENSGGDEKPIHNVTLSDFTIGKTEVTQELWQAVMGNNPSKWKGNNLPVENVNWNDCQDFLKKLNYLTSKTYRLPSEAEWEYAARGGVSSRSTIYSGSNTIADVAWYNNNSGSQTHAVAGKKPNELGLFDMSGNVYEWCSDWDGDYSSSPQTNPTGASSGSYRVIRGGSWGSLDHDCRVAGRNHYPPGNRDSDFGFRLVFSK